MRSRAFPIWLAVQLIAVHVHAPRDNPKTRNVNSLGQFIEKLPESAVRFYPCYTTFSNDLSEHQHLQYRRELPLEHGERRCVLVLKTEKELFVINLRLHESTHNSSIDLNLGTRNNNECWRGTVNNARESSAEVIKSNGILQTASIKFRDRKYIIERESASETKESTYILYEELDLNKSSAESANIPHETTRRYRRGFHEPRYGRLEYADEYSDEEALEGETAVDLDAELGGAGRDRNVKRQRCVLKLVADHTYFKKIGFSDTQKTRDSMIHQILRVNGILNLPFDVAPGLVRIFEKPTEVSPGEIHFNMPEEVNVTASQLLKSFSVVDRARNHDNSGFCLAFLFTARTIEGGQVRGLANIGHSTQERGVCATTLRNSSAGFEYVLNGGLATSMPQGRRMLTRDSDLLVAHEVAHGLGAEHDPDSGECSPSDKKGGPFLMSARPVSRYYKNYDALSMCSIRQITAIAKFKSGCFRLASSCGNMIVDEDEQCDVGMTEDDPCCDTQCRLRPNATCSDTNDLCCRNCQLMPEGTLCKQEFPNECLRESRCSGESGRCPLQKALPDNSSCIDRGQCWDGRCISYCEVLGMIPCLCRDENACTRCCKKSVDSDCQPIRPIDYLVDGTVCFNGLCQDRKCRKQVQDVIERILGIVSKLSPSYVQQLLRRYGTSLFIVLVSLAWIPLGIWVHCHDKRYYNIGGRNAGQITTGIESSPDIVPLSFNNENIEFIDEDESKPVQIHKINCDGKMFKETAV